MNNEMNERLEALLHYDSREAYLAKVHEELAELQVAIHHFEADKISIYDLIKEIADVEFQLEKLKYLYRSRAIDDVMESHKEEIYNHIDRLTMGEI